MALYGPLSLFGLVFFWMALVIVGVHAPLPGRARRLESWQRAFELQRLVVLHARLRRRAPGPRRPHARVHRGRVGPRPPDAAHRVPPDDLRRVLASRAGGRKLATRAGTPPTAVELLQRYHAIGWTTSSPSCGRSGRSGSPTSPRRTPRWRPRFFRSPNPGRSWVTAAGALLDAASLAQSTLAIPWSPRGGAVHPRRDARAPGDRPVLRDPVRPRPRAPTTRSASPAPSSTTPTCASAASGVPVRPDRDRAWRDFAGWRVNYDAVLLGLAGLTMAPYAPWSSDRSLRFRRRLLNRRRPRPSLPR